MINGNLDRNYLIKKNLQSTSGEILDAILFKVTM